MELTQNINTALTAALLTGILLGASLTAPEAWADPQMQPVAGPNFNLNQRQPLAHEAHVNVAPVQRAEPQHHQPKAQSVHQNKPAPKPQETRHDQAQRRNAPDNRKQKFVGHASGVPIDVYRNFDAYRHHADFLYIAVNAPIVVPDGFEAIQVNGQVFYYYQGTFYQVLDGQLTAIPAVLGAVVDDIPEDYQIVMADGVNYCVTRGVYYERTAEGFQVVEPPVEI